MISEILMRASSPTVKLSLLFLPDRYFLWGAIHPNIPGLEPLPLNGGLAGSDGCLHDCW